MQIKKITSADNTEIKHLKKLIQSPDFRHESGEYVSEGPKSMDNTARVKRIFIREGYEKPLKTSKPVFALSEKLFDSLAQTVNSQGIMAVLDLKIHPASELDKTSRYILLDRIQDPGNMGTIIRAACAFGFDGVILTQGCADPFSPKAVRSAVGGLNSVKIFMLNEIKQLGGLNLIACDMKGSPVDNFRFPQGFVLMIGNEANGLSSELFNAAGSAVSIPISGRMESLNAALAAGIFLFASSSQKKV